MSIYVKRLAAFAGACVLAVVSPDTAHAQANDTASDANPQSTQHRIDELKEAQKDLARLLRDNDARIKELEAEVNGREPVNPGAEGPYAAPLTVAPTVAQNIPEKPAPAPQKTETREDDFWGRFEPGKGFVVARSGLGEIALGVLTYSRYLNQLGLAPSYTDSFGRTFAIDRRQDVTLNKVSMTFKGWLLDPNFTYNTFVWTQNSSQGLAAQVEVAGSLAYRFNDAFTLATGVAPLPTTRSTNWTYPMWLRNDNRTLADEYFRGNFTFGIWANGKLGRAFGYRIMVGNNLNQIGVDDTQIDANFSTVSAALWWMPTTGEYGPANGFGDIEDHQKLATLFGVHFTYSPEDKQEQANVNAFENSQIRLSDGTLFFSPNAFNSGGQITRAHYHMLDLDAGLKYRGWSLEGEYYARWMTDFETIGVIPVSNLFDQGFQIQASTMLIPKQLQLYLTGSQVFGDYGNPWDISAGLNWYPFKRHEVRFNAQLNYVSHSPVGNLSIPYAVGGTGWIFNNDLIIAF